MSVKAWIYLDDPKKAGDDPDSRVESKGIRTELEGGKLVLHFQKGETTFKAYGALIQMGKEEELPDLWWVVEDSEDRRGVMHLRRCAFGWCEAEREGDEVELSPFVVVAPWHEEMG